MMRNLVLAAVLVVSGLNVSAQKSTHYTREGESLPSGLENYVDPQLFPFYHGVASGDPLADRVIIWTRVSPDDEGTVSVGWKVATDPELSDVVKQGTTDTDAARDFTVKIDVIGLQPGTTYYYGFSALGRNSLTGRTRTAPENTDHLKLAVVSCSNYQHGFFSAYRRIAERSDVDAVVHLGDYIYEYKDGDYGDARSVLPENEIVALEDYRIRYSFYRLDPDLRAAHQQHPFITIWDDHEFANDAYKDGAQNHQPEEGDWNVRKNNAWKSYFEWMPVRQNADPANPFRIYRTINYGNLVDLVMLDTRIEAREKQGISLMGTMKEAGKAMESPMKKQGGNRTAQVLEMRNILKDYLPLLLNVEGYKGSDDVRQENILTQKEFDYLLDQLSAWSATIGQKDARAARSLQRNQYVEVEKLIRKGVRYQSDLKNGRASKKLLGEEQFAWLESQLRNSQAKWKILGNQVMLFPVNALSISDTWDGYEDERTRLFNFLKDEDIENVAVVTGDIHTTFAADLPTNTFLYAFGKKNSVGVEFITPSITSSNFNEFVDLPDGFLTWLFKLFNTHVKEADLNNHGYMLLDIDEERIQSDWYYIKDVKKPNSDEFYAQSWLVQDGERNLREGSGPVPITSAAEDRPAPDTAPNAAGGYTHQGLVMLGTYSELANDLTAVHYFIDQDRKITAEIYDTKGNLQQSISSGVKKAGNHLLQIDTKPLRNGTYILSLSNGRKTVVSRFLVQR